MYQRITDRMMLSNDIAIPCVGFGLFQMPDGETTVNAIKDALDAGYRHIDTAAAYGNEASVGQGIRASDVKREDIFLTTKHWVTERGYEKTVRAVESSLERLGTEYLDLYLIHWPLVEKSSADWKTINASTWKGFERMYKDGKIRAIGVSNFLPHHLEALLHDCEIAPQVNQIECHPGYAQLDAVRWCQENKILVEAWSPLGSGRVLADETVCRIAAKYDKTSAQVCLRYVLQHDVLPLVKSAHRDRMLSNAQIFDFALANEDMQLLDGMAQTGYSGWHPDEAPAETYHS